MGSGLVEVRAEHAGGQREVGREDDAVAGADLQDFGTAAVGRVALGMGGAAARLFGRAAASGRTCGTSDRHRFGPGRFGYDVELVT